MAENQQKHSLTPTQERVLAALLHQPTIALAASEAKVNDRTIYRWLSKDEAFKAEYLRLRREIVNNAVFQLQKATNNAVNCLMSVMNDPEAPASARVRAAAEVLAQAMKALEIESFEERLERLEQFFAQQNAMTNGHYRHGVRSY
jgi:hypothetical protein